MISYSFEHSINRKSSHQYGDPLETLEANGWMCPLLVLALQRNMRGITLNYCAHRITGKVNMHCGVSALRRGPQRALCKATLICLVGEIEIAEVISPSLLLDCGSMPIRIVSDPPLRVDICSVFFQGCPPDYSCSNRSCT